MEFVRKAALIAAIAACLSIDAAAQDRRTTAEASDYRATTSSSDVVRLLDAFAATSANLNRISLGRTVEGREIAAVVAANPPIASAAQLRDDKRLVGLLLGNIHSGECAGKESLLMLARELSDRDDHPLFKDWVLVVAPNYNADGNERIGAEHRKGQIGPEQGAGQRENAQSLDLNRDFVKLAAPETRSLVRSINEWNPHLFMDLHTTNGSHHRYQLTYDIPHHPAVDPSLREFMRGELMPHVTEQLEEQQTPTFFYGNFDDKKSKWSTFGYQPRYSTEYVGVRGRLAILSEAYSYAPYRVRIEATSKFVRACLQAVGGRKARVQQLLERIAASSAAGQSVPVAAKIAKLADKVTIRGYDQVNEDYVQGDDSSQRDYQVDFFGVYEPSISVTAPQAYVVPRAASRVADRLRMHGIEIDQLTADSAAQLESYSIKKITRGKSSYEGARLSTAEVDGRQQQATVQAGDFLIATSQPLGTLAVLLLEPTADDGLLTWGFFPNATQQGDRFPIRRWMSALPKSRRPIEKIAARGRLTLDAIYGPRRRVAFGGAFALASWDDKLPRYRQRIGGKSYWVDAQTGARTSVESAPSSSELFRKLPGVDEKQAARMARSQVASSKAGDVRVFFFEKKIYVARGLDDPPVEVADAPAEVRVAQFNSTGDKMAFVSKNDLYVLDVKLLKIVRLTEGGGKETFNGILDWVYQEEVYGRGRFRAFWWSPDGQRIAYLSLNEEKVRDYTVADHIPVRQKLEVTRYPKSGDPIPSVRLGVVQADGGESQFIDLGDYGDTELLVVRVHWSPKSELSYQLQNRRQTWLELKMADLRSGGSRTWLREESDAWVNVLGEPKWLKNGSVLWLSERTGFKHIYRLSRAGELTPVTKGDWRVRSLAGVSPNENWVYYAGGPHAHWEQQAYRVPLEGGRPRALTAPGGYHTARFDKSFKYFLDFHSTAHSPARVDLKTAAGRFLRTVDPNLVDHVSYLEINEPEFVRIPIRDRATLPAMVIKPPNFDPARRYPVIMYVYAGPQASTVRSRWSGSTYLWHQMMAQRGYVICYCDNRSATGSAKLAWPIHKQLGVGELADLEDAVDWLGKQSWVDGGRVGIWGWSYGGYMTSFALTHSKKFKAGVAGAPVTDWKNYDAIYTERYMDLPQTNEAGYKASSVVEAAGNLHGRLLLIHGSIDDNVHLSNTMQLANALQRAGKQFDLMIYPKNRHGIGQPDQNRHLRQLMTRFFLENL